MICKFCNKLCKSGNSLANHERLCKLNPSRQTTPFQDKKKLAEIIKLKQSNGTTNQWANPNFSIAQETRAKLSKASKIRNANESTETKAARIKTINARVKQGTWHTSLSRRLHVSYNGVDLHGSWELKYAQWLDKNGIRWERCKRSFSYMYASKMRRYTPDFYLTDTDEFIEIKGFTTDKDLAKWQQFPDSLKLTVLTKKELQDLNIL